MKTSAEISQIAAASPALPASYWITGEETGSPALITGSGTGSTEAVKLRNAANDLREQFNVRARRIAGEAEAVPPATTVARSWQLLEDAVSEATRLAEKVHTDRTSTEYLSDHRAWTDAMRELPASSEDVVRELARLRESVDYGAQITVTEAVAYMQTATALVTLIFRMYLANLADRARPTAAPPP